MKQDHITTEKLEELTSIDNRRLVYKINSYKDIIEPIDSVTKTTEGLRRTVYSLTYTDAIFVIFTLKSHKELKFKVSGYTKGLFKNPTTSDDLEKFTGYKHSVVRTTISRNKEVMGSYSTFCDCSSGRNRYVFNLTPQQSAFYIANLSYRV